MKKLIGQAVILISLLCITFSCSRDESPTSETPILIKKITETIYFSETDFEIGIYDFIYEDNVLKKVFLNDNYEEQRFTYDGNKIVKIDYYLGGDLVGSTSFYYDGEKLSYTLNPDGTDERTIYSYTGNILSSIEYGYSEGTNFVTQGVKNYTFDSSSNISKQIINSGTESTKQIYTYDSKNNPMKYMNPYFKLSFECEGFNGLTKNNVKTREYYSPATTTIPMSNYNYEITYNDNFPIRIKKYNTDDSFLISDTVIEYQ